jgi:hypothetical protein
MATWIAHLRIAETLLDWMPELDPQGFAVGNIAPDSGIPDEKWEKFTPPTEVTHFKSPEGSAHSAADLDFYRRYLAGKPFPGTDPKRASFLFGYFCHLVTDNLWSALIYKPTRERYKTEFETIPGFIWEVKKDWYGLDFEYVRSHPDSLYWKTFLACTYPVNYLEFLLPAGVRSSIKHIQEYYQRNDEHAEERVNRPRIYLTIPEMDRFVETATRTILDAWQRLQAGTIQTEGMYSILESQP